MGTKTKKLCYFFFLGKSKRYLCLFLCLVSYFVWCLCVCVGESEEDW